MILVASFAEPASAGFPMFAPRLSVGYASKSDMSMSQLQPASRPGFSPLGRVNISSQRSRFDDQHPTVFPHSRRGSSNLAASTRAAHCSPRAHRSTCDAANDIHPRGIASSRRPQASMHPQTAQICAGPLAAASPLRTRKNTRHEKRNAHQCLAAGGMPDRDH